MVPALAVMVRFFPPADLEDASFSYHPVRDGTDAHVDASHLDELGTSVKLYRWPDVASAASLELVPALSRPTD